MLSEWNCCSVTVCQRPAALLKWAPTTAAAPARLCWAGPRAWAERASMCMWRPALTQTPAARPKPTAPSTRWGAGVFIMSLWIQCLDAATAAAQLTHNCRQVITHKHTTHAGNICKIFWGFNFTLFHLLFKVTCTKKSNLFIFSEPSSTLFMILKIK